MGLLDLPSPLFSAVDGALAFLPAALRLILWALLAAVVSMLLYRALSPQARLGRIKRDLKETRRELAAFDGPFDEAQPLIFRQLRLALVQVGLVLGPAVAASLPALCLLVYLSNAYGYRYPDQPVAAQAEPAAYGAEWRSGQPPVVGLATPEGEALGAVEVLAPVPVIHQRAWWNVLIGNPAGYLPGEWPVEAVTFDLPQREVVPLGPSWLRGWEAPFFAVLIFGSLALKVALRIH